MAVFGVYHGLVKNYYRWDMPLLQQNYFFNTPSAKIWVNPGVAANMLEIQAYFTTVAPPNSQLFVYSYAPYFYLLLDKQNPTRYDYIHRGILNDSIDQEIVTKIDQQKLSNIITNTVLVTGQTAIADYILSHYLIVKTVGDATLWRKVDET